MATAVTRDHPNWGPCLQQLEALVNIQNGLSDDEKLLVHSLVPVGDAIMHCITVDGQALKTRKAARDFFAERRAMTAVPVSVPAPGTAGPSTGKKARRSTALPAAAAAGSSPIVPRNLLAVLKPRSNKSPTGIPHQGCPSEAPRAPHSHIPALQTGLNPLLTATSALAMVPSLLRRLSPGGPSKKARGTPQAQVAAISPTVPYANGLAQQDPADSSNHGSAGGGGSRAAGSASSSLQGPAHHSSSSHPAACAAAPAGQRQSSAQDAATGRMRLGVSRGRSNSSSSGAVAAAGASQAAAGTRGKRPASGSELPQQPGYKRPSVFSAGLSALGLSLKPAQPKQDTALQQAGDSAALLLPGERTSAAEQPTLLQEPEVLSSGDLDLDFDLDLDLPAGTVLLPGQEEELLPRLPQSASPAAANPAAAEAPAAAAEQQPAAGAGVEAQVQRPAVDGLIGNPNLISALLPAVQSQLLQAQKSYEATLVTASRSKAAANLALKRAEDLNYPVAARAAVLKAMNAIKGDTGNEAFVTDAGLEHLLVAATKLQCGSTMSYLLGYYALDTCIDLYMDRPELGLPSSFGSQQEMIVCVWWASLLEEEDVMSADFVTTDVGISLKQLDGLLDKIWCELGEEAKFRRDFQQFLQQRLGITAAADAQPPKQQPAPTAEQAGPSDSTMSSFSPLPPLPPGALRWELFGSGESAELIAVNDVDDFKPPSPSPEDDAATAAAAAAIISPANAMEAATVAAAASLQSVAAARAAVQVAEDDAAAALAAAKLSLMQAEALALPLQAISAAQGTLPLLLRNPDSSEHPTEEEQLLLQWAAAQLLCSDTRALLLTWHLVLRCKPQLPQQALQDLGVEAGAANKTLLLVCMRLAVKLECEKGETPGSSAGELSKAMGITSQQLCGMEVQLLQLLQHDLVRSCQSYLQDKLGVVVPPQLATFSWLPAMAALRRKMARLAAGRAGAGGVKQQVGQQGAEFEGQEPVLQQ